MSDLINVYHDYETYSESDLRKIGAWKYAEHQSTDVICMAYAYEDRDVNLWLPGQPLPKFLQKEHMHKYRFNAWNSFFEWCVMKFVMNIEPPPISQWQDTMALAMAMSLPRSLGGCGLVMGLDQDKAKDKRGSLLIQRLCKPQRNGKRLLDAPMLQEMYDYCKQDVVAERAVSKKLMPLHKTEREVWELDQEINIRGIHVDEENIDNAICIYEQLVEELTEKIKKKTGINNPNSHSQFLDWLESRGYTGGNTQAGTLSEYVQGLQDGDLKEVILLKLSLSKTAAKKYYAIKKRIANDGRLHGNFLYHGASTGRWASVGINLQNLMRPAIKDPDTCINLLKHRDLKTLEMIYDNAMDALSSCIRGMICAAPGKELVVSDFASIEARVLPWLSGQDDVLEIFRGHGKIYEYTASKIYEKPIEEIDPKGPERFAGKTAVLALGYQGGYRALQLMASAMGVDFTDDFAQGIVIGWRNTNQKTVQYWDDIEQAFLNAVLRPGIQKVRNIQLVKKAGFLFCRLPSGRLISYCKPIVKKKLVTFYRIHKDGEHPRNVVFNPEVHSQYDFSARAKKLGCKIETFETRQLQYYGNNSKTRKWSKIYLYGGKEVENITQGVARDFLAHSMLALKKDDWELIMHVHDEPGAEADIGTGDLERFNKILSTLPEWAEDFPLAVDGYIAHRYRK